MGEELRWALLGAGGLFLAALAWWELRRPRHSRSDHGERADPRFTEERPADDLEIPSFRAAAESRATDLSRTDHRADPPLMVVDPQRSVPGSVGIDIADEFAIDEPGLRREPRIDDGAFETAEEEEVEPGFTAEPSPEEDPTGELEPIQAVDKRPPPEPRWPPEEQRRIVSLRLVPRPPARFGGRSLRLAFEGCGLEFGAFDIFHLADETGAVVASAANLMRPGTFAPDGMDTQYFHGVHLFCVLPGPLPAGRAVDELIALARDLAQRASGIVLDEVGRPLDEERAAAVRAEAEQAEAALAERGG